MSEDDTERRPTFTDIYPACAVCSEPVKYDQLRAYYEHEDTGELCHVGCYQRSVDAGIDQDD